MKNITTAIAALTLGYAMWAPALAQNPANPANPGGTASAGSSADKTPVAATASADAVMTAGEITRVDTRSGKLTIRHEDIKNLEMPAMTMIFALKDAAQAVQFNPGDKVRFHVQDDGGTLTITRIERAK